LLLDGFSVVKTPIIDPVAMAYHELRSPLSLVIMAARSAAEECPRDYGVLRTRCEAIVRAAERMLSTAQEILALAEPNLAEDNEFELSESLVSAVGEFRELGVRLSLASLPSGPRVQGSRRKFETLIVSLLNNAVEHGAAGTDFEVRSWKNAGDAFIEIRNVIAPTDTHVGYGLGARVAQELARSLHADIQCSAQSNVYRVTVRIPLALTVAVAS
jgi:signal transduction histidine kinase